MSAWTYAVRLAEAQRGPLRLALTPDAAQRADIARGLGLESLPALSANVVVRPWLDGAELQGRVTARVEQVCGVSLEPFEQTIVTELDVRVVPPGSANAPQASIGELALDLESPDPPDVLSGDSVDAAAYVVEALALAIDPFPRKPGAAFEFELDPTVVSPFAALRKLKSPDA